MADSKPRLFLVQFSFANADAIPHSVRHVNPETIEEQTRRKSLSSGTKILEPTKEVSLVNFLDELESAGYEMVNAIYQQRRNAHDPNGNGTYHMVRFVFAPREFTKLSDEFRKMRNSLRAELRSICEAALWRVRAFSNLFYEDGREVIGLRVVNVNCEVRQPLFRPNGEPVTVWQTDERKRHIGDAPLPLAATHHLHIVDGSIQLVAARSEPVTVSAGENPTQKNRDPLIFNTIERRVTVLLMLMSFVLVCVGFTSLGQWKAYGLITGVIEMVTAIGCGGCLLTMRRTKNFSSLGITFFSLFLLVYCGSAMSNFAHAYFVAK